MKLPKPIHLIIAAAVAMIIVPQTLFADDSTDFPVGEDPVRQDENKNKHNDYVEPPVCSFSKDRGEVRVCFDYYCGDATVTVTSSTAGVWTVTSSTMVQPILCPFGGAAGEYSVSITTTTGLAFRGSFVVK